MPNTANTTPPAYAKQVAALQALESGLTKHQSTLPAMLREGYQPQRAASTGRPLDVFGAVQGLRA